MYLCSNSVAGCKNKRLVFLNSGEEINIVRKYHEQMDRFFNK